MRSLLAIVFAAAASYYYCDVRSGKTVQAVLMPLVFILSITALALWIHARTRHRSRFREDGRASVSFGSGSGFGGSDD